ncbi:hypothetical protein [Methanotorris formicicus]|uniref:Uncharacterized protein n=1 Tax=Methanotorris formicicus Mc-S-70 TaxID=647171 RepID=H1KW44_9EURY|nr:hypothetical protein [Methanotorris formicicus]EHP84934.1 hypothetical protein MetfoDRAFT_1514 [Methanotorris formicicus Mc-S-70]EHP85897.1 hypothetical protein MetfoDRAFT_1227 [Methanotorris formicicus Mc-S-70]EHP89627.1 hypothetical protein MetfoDRAFT_0017 [Methanotorris formicicus Mc-S-70]
MKGIKHTIIKSFNEFNSFVGKALQITPRIYRVEGYSKGFIKAIESNTYLETISTLGYPSVDSYYRYIKNADISMIKEAYKYFVKSIIDDFKKDKRQILPVDGYAL